VSQLDFVCGISASSRTPFVLAALREAKRRGAFTGLVCCNRPYRLQSSVDAVLAADTGPELVAGSTRLKAGTATKAILNALSTAAFVALGRVYRGRMVSLRPNSAKLRARAERTVADLAGISPSHARWLLRQARGRVRIALAMQFTGLPRAAAQRALQEYGLRRLEMLASSR
jgi:N-acetylmuramic acid 6-phosphate etherase